MPETVSCGNFESLAVLHALGELETSVRAAVEEHARVCPDCAARLQREMALAGILGPSRRVAGEQEPSDLLLGHCRSELGKSLDAAVRRPSGWREWLRPHNWAEAFRVSAHVHPGWSVAALLFVAVVSGLAGWEGLGRVPLRQFAPTMITVSAASPPPVAPAVSEIVPQPEPEAPAAMGPAVDAAAENSPVYAATDTGMSRSEELPRLWRHEPPLRMPRDRGPAAGGDAPAEGHLAGLSRRMETLWWGGVRIDPYEQQRRLVIGSLPEYPEVARRAGIEGPVTLLLRIGTDGSVEDAQLLSGEPVLGRAAAAAVEQWRYQPAHIEGQPVNVLTSVTLAFELR